MVALAIPICTPAGYAAPGRFTTSPDGFRLRAKAPQSLYIYNAGSPGEISGEYARYSIPELKLQETSVADGMGSQVAFGVGGEPFFLDESGTGSGFAVYEIPSAKGVQPGVQQFSGVPCYASSFATGPTGDFYAVQYCSGNVLEYSAKSVKGGGAKKPIATFSGGNFGSGPGGPTYAVVDKFGGLYVGDTGGGVTYFPKGKKTPVIAFPTGSAGYVNQMITDASGDVWSIHGPNPTNIYFKNATSCVIDPKGSIARNELAERFSKGTLVQQYYTGILGSNDEGNDGLSIALDSKQRIYAGVNSPDDPTVVLDYDPGKSCPTDALAIVGPKGASPQVNVAANGDLYVTDYIDNTISAYAGASTKLINQITQATGLINIMYASLE